ncbi:basic leucine zipper 43-like [Hibiscus syriacus]|uniref:basic leucine zipper 43-like n=1 Tax=Hibiscus syriacus TaxID=106335 RepID=UPI0019245791|nr:basic leucine zipper 43-like [Hibiscus syriacus]
MENHHLLSTLIRAFSPMGCHPTLIFFAQRIVFEQRRRGQSASAEHHCQREGLRMISNRDSTRRSRMRKKQQIEGPQSQVNKLQTVNRQLSQKVINLLENNHEILQENFQLKRVSTLHNVLSDVFAPLRNSNDPSMTPKSTS